MSNAGTYESDFHAWTTEQARLLRAGRVSEADLANIAEELESMGRSERRELVSRLGVLLAYLLKWRCQPGLRGNSWRLTIREQRRKLDRHLRDNPSLRANLDAAMDDAYGDALLEAQRETGLPEAAFPERCPWTHEQIMAEGFFPD
ncbi:MAG TPA: DUF29 domain-containing protein [Acetobacteraceae bacterium]|nr:DUF29 domain-containing protein [Acetobacteraceae bacterium]